MRELGGGQEGPSQARIVGTWRGAGESWLQTLPTGDHGQWPRAGDLPSLASVFLPDQWAPLPASRVML